MAADPVNPLVETLGPPAVSVGQAALWQGYALELLQQLPDGCAQLVLSSPPYNLARPKSYEDRLDIDVYAAWCRKWIAQLHRVCADDGAVWLNLGYTLVPGQGLAVPIPYLLWPFSPFHMVQEVVWHYRAGVACRHRFSPRNEKLLWLEKAPGASRDRFDLDAVRVPALYPDQSVRGRRRVNPLGKNPGDVWEIPKVTSGAGRSSPERVAHPAQMPLALAERVIVACSRPDELVLDPFAGSGTTLVAASGLGRQAAGFETDAGYVRLAAQRLGVGEA